MKYLITLLATFFILNSQRSTVQAAAPAPTPKTGQTLCYNSTSGTVIPCAGTGQDGALQPGVAWPTPRFTDNGNGTVADNLTGIIWLKNPGCYVAQSWDAALGRANTLSSGACGLTDGSLAGDWHLPNKNELLSLLDYGHANPALPTGHPFTSVQPSDYYWSATSRTTSAWVVGFFDGFAYPLGKSSSYYVWPVRSGQLWALGSLILYAATTEYGNVAVGTSGAPKLIRLQNNGATPVTITATTLTGTDTTQFSVAPGGSNACASLTPLLAEGTNCTLAVAAVPTSSGAKSANLTITTASGSQDIPLNATGFTTIYGVVSDQATGLPVAGASVTRNSTVTITTAADGSYTFGAVPFATYSISIAKTGYQTTTKSGLVVTAATSAQADILLPTTGALNITSTSLPWASTGVPYISRVMVAGGTVPYTFGKLYGNLPTGLSLDTASGAISGTPTGSGSYTFGIGVSDSAASPSPEKEFVIDLVAPLQITTASLPAGQQGVVYSSSFSGTGGKPSYKFSIIEGTLPVGITLGVSGVLSGTPRAFGTSTFKVKLTDSTGITVNKSYALSMSAAPTLTLDTTTLPQGIVGSLFTTTTLSASGGMPPRTFTITSGTLPTGLSLNGSTGKITGTPSVAGLINLTFTVTDYSYPTGKSASVTLPLRIWNTTSYLDVSFSGDGSGSVHSSPLSNISCIKGLDGGCSAQFTTNSVVTLTATPDIKTSIFESWSNACTAVPCEITMNGNKTATTTFTLAPKSKLNVDATTGFDTFSLAYGSATSSILAMDAVLLGDWTLDDATKDIVFKGGYQADYKARTGFTVLNGSLYIKAGSLRVDGLVVRPLAAPQ